MHILNHIITFIRRHVTLTNSIEVISIFVTAIATMFMAFTSWHSLKISDNVAKMTRESILISERLANQDLTRLKTELRPYLIIELAPGANEYLKKDGNSQLSIECCYNTHLILPFKIKNVGKMLAINIKAEYTSPTQKEVDIALGERSLHIPPDAEAPETFRPHINIGSILSGKEINEFEATLRIVYEGYHEVDSRIYYSELKLFLKQRQANEKPLIYDIIESNFKFGFENEEIGKGSGTISSEKVNDISALPETNSSDQLFLNFNLAFAQSVVSIFAVFWIFLIFRLEAEDRRLDRTYDSAKNAIVHPGCLDKDVKFYFLESSYVMSSKRKEVAEKKGARDIRIQVHNLEEVKSTLYPLINTPIYLLSPLFLFAMLIFIFKNHDLTHDWITTFWCLILIGLFTVSFSIVMKKFKILTKDANQLVFNAPNPYLKINTTGMETNQFYHLSENIDLIERDTIEFPDFYFKMNYGFEKVERAIQTRKERFGQINNYRKEGKVSFENFLSLKLTEKMLETDVAEAKKIIEDEERDRSLILSYISRKYKISDRSELMKIFTDISEEITEHYNKS